MSCLRNQIWEKYNSQVLNFYQPFYQPIHLHTSTNTTFTIYSLCLLTCKTLKTKVNIDSIQRACSSVGQSSTLIMYWSQVRVLAGPPKSYYKFNKNYFILSHFKNARFQHRRYLQSYLLQLINSNEKNYIMRLSYLTIFIATALTVIIFWASSNVCRFNFAIKKNRLVKYRYTRNRSKFR